MSDRLRVVHLSLSPSCVTRKKTACHARRTKRIMHDGLSERGTTRSLRVRVFSLSVNSCCRVVLCCVVLKGKLTTWEKVSSLEYFGQKFLLGVGRAL